MGQTARLAILGTGNIGRAIARGLAGAMGYAREGQAPHAPWAERALLAHRNGVENLVLFAALVLTAHTIGLSNTVTQTACAVYFFARLVHFAVYAMGIPVIRTLAFAMGFGAQIAIAVEILASSQV